MTKIKWIILISSLMVLTSMTALAMNSVRSVGNGPVFSLYPALNVAGSDGLSNFAILSDATGVEYDAFLDGKKFFSSGKFTDFTINVPFDKPFYRLVVKAFGAYDTSVATALIVAPSLGVNPDEMLNVTAAEPAKNGTPVAFVTVNSGFGRKNLTVSVDGKTIEGIPLSTVSDSPEIFEIPLAVNLKTGEHVLKADLKLITGQAYTDSVILNTAEPPAIVPATPVAVSKAEPPAIRIDLPTGGIVWEKTAPAIVKIGAGNSDGSKSEVRIELNGTPAGTTLKISKAGLYDLSVVATDPKSGLRSSTDVKFRVSFDDNPPKILSVTSSSTAGKNKPVTVGVETEDAGIGVKDVTVNGIQARHDGSRWVAEIPSPATDISGIEAVKLRVEVSDALGNIAETSISTSVFVDVGRPYVKIESNADSQKDNVLSKNSAPLVLTVEATTDSGISPDLSVELDGKAVSGAVNVPTPGTHRISVTATDTVSGLSTKYDRTFVVDFTAASQTQTTSEPSFNLEAAVQWLPAMVITIATVAVMLLTVLR